MTPKPARAPATGDDPIARALESAPLHDVADSSEETAELAARRANPVFVPGSAVSAELAAARPRDEE